MPVAKKSLSAYRLIVGKTCNAWRKHGALEIAKCVGDDVKRGKHTSFPQSVKLKPAETGCSRTSYTSRRCTAIASMQKRMKGSRLAPMMDHKVLTFGGRRLIF